MRFKGDDYRDYIGEYCRGYIGIVIGVISGLYRDNGKENGSHYLGFAGFGPRGPSVYLNPEGLGV